MPRFGKETGRVKVQKLFENWRKAINEVDEDFRDQVDFIQALELDATKDNTLEHVVAKIVHDLTYNPKAFSLVWASNTYNAIYKFKQQLHILEDHIEEICNEAELFVDGFNKEDIKKRIIKIAFLPLDLLPQEHGKRGIFSYKIFASTEGFRPKITKTLNKKKRQLTSEQTHLLRAKEELRDLHYDSSHDRDAVYRIRGLENYIDDAESKIEFIENQIEDLKKFYKQIEQI